MQLSIRITYISIFVTVLIVSATYSGNLTSIFTTPPIELPFNNLNELFEQTEYEIITLQESSEYDVFFVSFENLDSVKIHKFKIIFLKLSRIFISNKNFLLFRTIIVTLKKFSNFCALNAFYHAHWKKVLRQFVMNK